MESFKDFATRVKSKYPEYKNVDDLDLSKRIVSKYPEYKDVVDFSQTTLPVTDNNIAAKATSVVNRLTPHFQPTLQTKTIPGQVLETLGKVMPPDIEKSQQVREATKEAIGNIVIGERLLPRPKFRFEHPIRAGIGMVAQTAVDMSPFSSMDAMLLAAGKIIPGMAKQAALSPIDDILDDIGKNVTGTPVSGAGGVGKFHIPTRTKPQYSQHPTLMPYTIQKPSEIINKTISDMSKESIPLIKTKTVSPTIETFLEDQIKTVPDNFKRYLLSQTEPGRFFQALQEFGLLPQGELSKQITTVENWNKYRGIIKYTTAKTEPKLTELMIPERMQTLPMSQELALGKTPRPFREEPPIPTLQELALRDKPPVPELITSPFWQKPPPEKISLRPTTPEVVKPETGIPRLIKPEPFAKARPETEPILVKDPVTQEIELQKPVTPEDAIEIQPGKWAVIKRKALDRFSPIRFKKGQEIAPEFKGVGGENTEDYVNARLLKGKVRYAGENALERINDSLNPLKNNKELLNLEKIYRNRNFADLDRLEKTTSGITAEMAENELLKLKTQIGEANFNRISKAADDLAKVNNDMGLDILVDGDIISRETAEIWRKRYPNYLRSEITDEELKRIYPNYNSEAIGKSDKGFLKTKRGTQYQINTSVVDVVRRNILSKIAFVEKQKVIDGLAERWGKQIGQQFYREGKLVSEVDPFKIPKGFVRSQVKTSGGKVFALPEDVYNLVEGLNSKEADLATKAMAKYNALFRVSATGYRLKFALGNLPRDIQTALQTHRYVPGQANQPLSYIKAFIPAIQESLGIKNSTVQAWKKGGGAYGGIVTSIPKEVPIPFRLLPRGQQISKVTTAPITIPFEAVNKLASFTENTSRLAEYIRLKNTNLPESLKILNSRDVTIDFEKFGDNMRIWNKWIPFLNPMVQGNYNTARAFYDQPMRAFLKVNTYIVAPTIAFKLYRAANKNDKTVDPYIKQNYWYIHSGITVKRNNIDASVLFAIPKSEFAKQVSYPIETLLEYAMEDPQFKTRAKDWTAAGIGSSVISTLVPPLARTPLESIADYDFYRRQQLTPDRLRNVKKGFQFKAGTTNIARRLGEITGISPIRFEHAIKGLYPASGQVLEVADTVLKPKPTIPRSDRDLLQRIQTFQPFILVPSGYYNPEEEKARTFKQQKDVEAGTPKFLFREALSRYLVDKTPANLELVQRLGKKLIGKERSSITKDVVKDFKISTVKNDKTRAIYKILPRKYRKEFISQ